MFGLLVCVCVSSECVKEFMDCGFSQNLQTQIFNTYNRLHLSFYTSLLQSRAGLGGHKIFIRPF